jgi:hypothetical protein
VSVNRYHRRRVSRRHSRRAPNENKWYNLAMGVLGELAGGNHEAVQGCLPDEWKTEGGEQQPAQAETDPSTVTQSSGVLEKIVSIVGGIIDMFCKVKDWVKGLLVKRLYKRYHLKYSFIQRKMRKWGWLSRAWNSVKSAAKSVGNAVVSAGKAVYNGVKAGVSWVYEQAKKVVMAIVGKITEVWNSLVEKIQGIFNSPIVQKLLGIFECLQGLQGAAAELVAVVKGIITKVRKIMTMGLLGLVDVLLDLICNWKEFKAAVDFLLAGIRESNTVQKFKLIGKFIGKLLFAIGKARRLRHFYNRLKLLRLRK